MYNINTDNPIASQTKLVRHPDRNLDAESIFSKRLDRHLKRSRRDGSDMELKPEAKSSKWNLKGEEDRVKHTIRVIRKEDNGYWISGEARRGNHKFSIELGTDDEDLLDAEFAKILTRINALLMMLFDDHLEVARSKMILNADESSKEKDDLRSKIKRVELTEESWLQYESKNLQWREIIEGSGLVCGKESSSLYHVSRQIKQAGNKKIRKVLILGEHGTGKELAAKAIHDLSPRKSGPYIALHIGTLPEHLIASELFGHKKGTFTGAISDKKGAFEEADRGILFLDEIGTMSIKNQQTLLRVLEVGAVLPLGSTKPIEVDVLTISATNADLNRMMSEGSFGEDLYYRLNEVIISLPPLRERHEDIPALIQFFSKIDEINQNEKEWKFDKKLFKALIWYDWPGNIRQLKNFIIRIHALSEESNKKKIGLEDLEFENTNPSYHDLKMAYRKYQAYSKQAILVSSLADIAAKMFIDTWKVLENAWEKWQESRTVQLGDIRLEKELFYQELDDKNRKKLTTILWEARNDVKAFLESQGYSGIKDSNCYNMLFSCYESEKTTKGILKLSFEKLQKMNLDLSHKLEIKNYDRCKEFFGKTYRSMRDWN